MRVLGLGVSDLGALGVWGFRGLEFRALGFVDFWLRAQGFA